MARRYEIDDVQWEKIKPYLGNTPKKTGRPQADNRKLLNGVLWIMHTGAPWRDLPEYYGPWQTVYKRFSQWQKDEKLRQLFESVRENPDMQDLCIDGTYIKAHRSSVGAKKRTPGYDDHQHIGISRGGRSTKIHAVVDGLVLCVAKLCVKLRFQHILHCAGEHILQHFLYVPYRLRVVQLDHFTNRLVTTRIPFIFFHVLHLLYLLYHTLGVYTIYFT